MPKSKIIKELINDEISLEKALYRVITLAKDLKDTKLEQWAKNEVNGYGNSEEIPEYRRANCLYFGSYIVGDMKYSNAPLPTEFLKKLSPEEQKNIMSFNLGKSITMLEQSIKTGEKIGIPIAPEILQVFSIGTNAEILLGQGEIDQGEILQILNKVKTKILDILYELEEKFGCLDDIDISDSDDKVKNEAKQKISQIIVCDTYSNVEIGNGNTIKKSSILSKLLGRK